MKRKKPEVEVTPFNSEECTKGKTNLKEFLKSMPEGFSDIFRPVFERWVDNDFHISWGTVGFTIRANYRGKLKTLLEVGPYYYSFYSKKWEKSRKLPSEICEKFRNRVKRNPLGSRMLNENRSYIYFKDTTIEDFTFILNELDKTVRELIQYYESIRDI